MNQHIPENTTFTIVDLADFPVPISPTTSVIPAGLKLPLPDNAYGDPQVDAWSLEIRKYNAFIFLTPQYNWSFTGAIKVAIDHLYHEWHGKTGMVVAYGNRGGGKAAGHLRQVLQGIRMKTREESLELPIKPDMDVEVAETLWKDAGKEEELLKRFEELLEDIGKEPPAY